MDNPLLPLLPVFAASAALLLTWLYRRHRNQRLLSAPFPEDWAQSLEKELPIYSRLDANQRHQLQQMIQLFLADKAFYGCAGLTVTDNMKLSIAAQACLLCLGRQGSIYPRLQAILIYPGAFFAEREHAAEDGTVAESRRHLLGESWDNGRIILSWDDVEAGGRDFTDGHNVVLHEFAHQLDAASGSTNGAPVLMHNDYHTWARVFSDNFSDLRDRAVRGQPTVMDTYGATNEAEFFAVATETFFEQPGELREHRPELYEQLKAYYELDPEQWQR